jgi:TP901 family phage tail tape measure protein
MAQGFSIKGKADLQQILTALIMQNQQLLQTNLNIERINKTLLQNTARHRQASGAAKGQANSMKTLAMRFVGYNLAMNAVMGAQQKLVEFTKESVVKFREYETRLAEISTILQEDVLQMDRFKAGISSLAITYGQATSDISKGLYDILSAAFDSRDAMNLLNTSIKASIAGLSDVRTSVKIFTTVLNSYGKSAEQATHVSDVLFQSVVRGKFQFEDLEQALGYVVPIAAQAGIAFDELSAALSTATRHGLHIDMTARGLALAIQGIINPSEKARKAAREYGVEMNGLALRVLGLKGWFDQLGDAMDEHGKSILGELVPNMRSLRVAMVLAGEEGALGFAEDLRYLENVSGRTQEALVKMMETSAFASKQLAEEMAKTSREIGEDWDDLMLKMQGGTVWVAKHWKNLLPVVGSLFTLMEAQGMKMQAQWKNIATQQFRVIDGSKNLAYNLENYIGLKKEEAELSEKIASLRASGEDFSVETEQLEHLISLEPALEEVWNTQIGGIKDTQDALGEYEITLNEIELDISRLDKALNESVTVGWGSLQKTLEGTLGLELAQLEMAQKLKDSQHDVKMGLISSSYGWKTNNSALKEAVDIVREHEDAQKADTQATQQMTIAMRLLQIQMLEIQLAGMMRRRGLTRNEQKKMKALQIEQAKLRLENMKSTHQETAEMHTDYNEKKQFIKEFLVGLEEESYQLHYKYDYDLAELEKFIDSEESALVNRYDYWEKINNAIFDSSAQLILDMNALPSPVTAFLKQEQDIDIAGMVESTKERRAKAQGEAGTYNALWQPEPEVPLTAKQEEQEVPWQSYFPDKAEQRSEQVKPKDDRNFFEIMAQGFENLGISLMPPKIPEFGDYFKSFSRGTERVPNTMPAIIHRDEKISPAGRRDGDGGTTIHQVTIQVQQVSDIDSVEKMGAALGAVKQTGVTDRRGRVKYRL